MMNRNCLGGILAACGTPRQATPAPTPSPTPFAVQGTLHPGEYVLHLSWTSEVVIDEIHETHSIDPKRVYLIGDGKGGNGVWVLGLHDPGYFAALIPVGGYIGYPFAVPENICDLKNVPVWAFHGERDMLVPVEVAQELVDAVNSCGGDAKITISSQMDVDILYTTYTNPALFEWLQLQSKE